MFVILLRSAFKFWAADLESFLKSSDWSTQSRFSVVFLCPRANAEFILKFHIALHALYAVFQIQPKLSPYC
jgi:hypothetical protein